MKGSRSTSGARVRVAVVALAVSLSMFLGACGGGGSSPSGTTQEQRPSTSHPVTLTVWDWDYFAVGLKPYLSIVDKQFEATHPGVTINHVPIPYESAPEKYHAAVAAQQGPDVITMYSGAYSAPFRQGLVSLDSRISPAQRSEWEWLQDAVAPNGHIYVIPFGTEGYVFVYNKKMFAQAKVTPPKTWNEWLTDCEKLKAAGMVPQTGGWKEGEHLSDYFQDFSDDLLSAEEDKKLFAADLPLTGHPFAAALEDFLTLQKHGCFNKNADALTMDEAYTHFALGRAASSLQSTAFGPLSRTGIYPKNLGAGNIGVVPVPLVPGSVYSPFMSSGPRSGWAITRWSQHQDLAWEYISYIMRKQSFELAFKKVELLPSVRDVSTETSYAPAQTYLQYLKWPHNNGTFTAYPQDVYEVLTRQAVPLANGSVKPRAVLEQMQAQEQQDKARLKE